MKRKTVDPKVFWKEYEEECGEKVLANCLGQYLSGWDDFQAPLWGLVIAAENSLRFHHFAEEGWFTSMIRTATRSDPDEEKTLEIRKENLLSVEYLTEKSLIKKILFPSHPHLVIRYTKPDGSTGEVKIEVDKKAEALAAVFKV